MDKRNDDIEISISNINKNKKTFELGTKNIILKG